MNYTDWFTCTICAGGDPDYCPACADGDLGDFKFVKVSQGEELLGVKFTGDGFAILCEVCADEYDMEMGLL